MGSPSGGTGFLPHSRTVLLLTGGKAQYMVTFLSRWWWETVEVLQLLEMTRSSL